MILLEVIVQMVTILNKAVILMQNYELIKILRHRVFFIILFYNFVQVLFFDDGEISFCAICHLDLKFNTNFVSSHCSITGSPPSKVYGNMRAVASRSAERF